MTGRTIRVTGKGRISVSPDTIKLSIDAESVYKEYETTIKKSAEDIAILRETIKKAGLDPKELKTVRFGIDADYESYRDKDGNYKRKFNGYKYTHDTYIQFSNDNKENNNYNYINSKDKHSHNHECSSYNNDNNRYTYSKKDESHKQEYNYNNNNSEQFVSDNNALNENLKDNYISPSIKMTMKHMIYGVNCPLFQKNASFVWAKKITSGRWAKPVLAAHAAKFTLTAVQNMPATIRMAVRWAYVTATAGWKSGTWYLCSTTVMKTA
jgi:hypothetical protein